MGGGVIARHGVLTLHNRSSSDQQIDVNCSVTTVFDRFVYNYNVRNGQEINRVVCSE